MNATRNVHLALRCLLIGALASCGTDENRITSPHRSNPLAFSSTWPEEPVGFTSFVEYGFDSTLGTSPSTIPAGDGWMIYNPNGYASQVTTATDAPLTPPNIGEFSYPVGFGGGTSPAMLYLQGGQNKEVFAGIWWKASSPWQDPTSASSTMILSIATTTDGSSQVYLELSATGSTPPHRLDVVTQFTNIPSARLTPNTTTTDVGLGTWHRIEWYLKYSTTPTSNDGVIRWWLDGVLQGDYTNQDMPADAGFVGYVIQPTWTGTGNKTEQDYFWYDQVHVGVPSATWPAEPSGFTPITDYGFPTDIPTSAGPIPDGSGWQVVFNSQGSDGIWNTTRTDDPTAPLSPASVAQWRYPTGFSGGSAPGTLFFDHTAQTDVFAGFWWKPSNPWQNHSSNVNKIAFWGTGTSGGSIDIQMYGQSGNTYNLHVVSEFTGVPTVRFQPNVTTSNITLGQWHRVEWHMKYATTPGGSNGVLEWWLDGVLQGQYTDMETPNDAGFNEFKFSPTWGGVGDQKTETDYYWVDQVHLSHS